MSTHKFLDKICAVCIVFAMLLTIVCINGEAFGVQAASTVMGYESRLFDTGKVHTLDIVIDDWEGFLATCQSEEYSVCSVVIDGEAFKDVGIRGKGNTSLTNVASMDSDRYSFKIEFDQYDSTKTYYGLDKLSLNNLIQDTTFMKDYLTYRLMGSFGVAAPLCSYVYLTVNGEDWGLYLAVEGIEDAFLRRNYGNDYGALYKPDSMSFGGGRGNGRDFNMEDLMNVEAFGGFASDSIDSEQTNTTRPSRSDMGGFDPSAMGGGFGGGSGMGSDDVRLRYIDDDPDSYANIFDNAKTDVSEADQTRLIASLKQLSAGESLEAVVDIESVIRYFVVHNFVVNGDSYTGSMIHNYYLYEEDGRLSMLPWDYNLAFGTFQSSGATDAVNDPIDTPAASDDLPMLDWIFADETYTELYHRYFAEFLAATDFATMIDTTAALIAPYVEKDPTKFFTCEEFETGVATLRVFCLLREQSILGQLDGTIPATTTGQNADNSALIDASHITISDMGSMNMGGNRGGFMPSQMEGFDPSQMQGFDPSQMQSFDPSQTQGFDPSQMQRPNNMSPAATDTAQTIDPTQPDRQATPPSPQPPSSTTASGNGTVLLIVSVALLAAGLVFAFKFKR